MAAFLERSNPDIYFNWPFLFSSAASIHRTLGNSNSYSDYMCDGLDCSMDLRSPADAKNLSTKLSEEWLVFRCNGILLDYFLHHFFKE